ncbi:hypothetical protein F5148DRAFT_1147433 [Russula earlei]|uniref:Uncharacterized protein n=1 Tax=Russula earlei TaxID=71964 RepID=A0ACC0UH41_9AGAM|nr:hypothetical protein F5148DRAFT_1147433 [Russula earlei]
MSAIWQAKSPAEKNRTGDGHFTTDACHLNNLTDELSPSLLPCTAPSSTTIGGPSEASLEASPCEHRQDRVTINTLPDDVLVEIFHFCVDQDIRTNGWHTLVHVCQRWRDVVFASPRRLNLRLWYSGKRPMSEMLDVWPVLPVEISRGPNMSHFWENVAAALESEHHHRICKIGLFYIPTTEWERLAATMQKPFPELTYLRFRAEGNTVTSLPDSFLGGSAPLLRELWLANCYIAPRDLVIALSVMSRLEILALGFRSLLYPASRPPLTRSVLPALTQLTFRGVHEYLEDLLAQIKAPVLNHLGVSFYTNLGFVIPQLGWLISQTESFKTCDTAIVYTSSRAIRFTASRGTNRFPELSLEVRCRELNLQLSLLAQACSSSFLPLSTLVQLDILDGFPPRHLEGDVVTAQWLELLDPFTAVKDLRLSRQIGRHVCQALKKLAEARVDVLPALQNTLWEGLEPLDSVPKYIEGFVAARKLSGHPVVVHHWE